MAQAYDHRRPLGIDGVPHIGGQPWHESGAAEHPHIDPATGEVQATLRLGGARAIDAAVNAAASAQKQWLALPPAERRRCLHRLSDLLLAHDAELAFLGARESGIPVALQGVAMARGWIEHYAGWIDKIEGGAAETAATPGFHYTRREPYGVVGVIIPWNGPLIATCMMAIPPIAAGNAVVLKPPALAPFVALRFAQLCDEAGLPAGLLNVVPGEAEAGEALVVHPGVGKLSFTGGEGVARRVLENAAKVLKPVVLELGGKSANLVFDDADLDNAAAQAVYGALGLSGQGCVNPTRLLVQHSRYAEMVERAAAVAAAMPVGDPLDPRTQMGPVISQAACQRILGMIERARGEGRARLVAGGTRLGGALEKGWFIAPTVFADVQPGSTLDQNEVFGPVLAITPFEDEDEALAIANGTRYGLGAYLHTRDLDRAHRLAAQLEAGYVNINGFAMMSPDAPFGGYRQSGFGRTGGRHGLEEFLQLKNVFIARRS